MDKSERVKTARARAKKRLKRVRATIRAKAFRIKADMYRKESDANRARAIDEATGNGAIVPVVWWDEPEQYKDSIIKKLCAMCNDRNLGRALENAIALLDEQIQRQNGKYIFFIDGRVGQNTTDTDQIKGIVSDEVLEMVANTPQYKRVEYYLNHWRQQAAPITGTAIPDELNTPKARQILERAVKCGLLTPEYVWIKTTSLYGYFVDKVSEELSLNDTDSGKKHTPWKLFHFIKLNGKESTARAAVNDYSNKGLPPPQGEDIINELLKGL